MAQEERKNIGNWTGEFSFMKGSREDFRDVLSGYRRLKSLQADEDL